MPFMNSLSPNQIAPSQQMFSMRPPQISGPPEMAPELINDVKQINLSLAKLVKIEHSVNRINMKVST